MRLRAFLVLLLLVVGVGSAVVAVVGPSFGASPTVDYLTTTVTRRTVVKAVAATGQVVPRATYALSFGAQPRLVSGSTATASSGGSSTWLVTEVDVAVGDRVKAGQVLAKADTKDLQVQLDIATANWRAARTQQAIAQSDLDAATTTDAQRQARIALYNAEAQVAQTERTRTQLQAQIAAATLTAPVDGIVTAVFIAPGVLAPNGDAIVIEAGPLEVSAQVAEADLSALAVGQTATVTVSAVGATLTGRVEAVAPVASTSGNSSVVTFPVTISLQDPPANLASGMSVTVSIETGRAENALAVPVTALTGTSGNVTVRVVDPTGQIVVQPVEVGLVGDEYVEIKSGLNEGEVVVTGTASARQTTQATGGFGVGLPGGFGGGVRGVPGR
ncbi:MAG TPA: efflux RND transporter periplasmic adaptor subunit [Candidatus Binatia bacterium]|nr:efflux RND transporter periplasmic adaptor subunit [Candidatus Binatia bacterium]